DGIRDRNVTGVQTCALPISTGFLLGKLTSTKNEMVTSSSETKMKMKSTAETRYIKPAQVRSGSEKNSPRFADVLSSALRKAGARSEERRVGKEWRGRGWRGG